MPRNPANPRGPRKRPELKHGLSYCPEYRVWQGMRLRCTEPSNAAYPDYGGRGITICDRWLNSPENFMADMGQKPTAKHEIDRIDNDKGYEPGNCRWALRKENDRNRRSNRFVEFEGQTKTVAEWCELLGIRGDTLRWRLNKGWSIEMALFTQSRSKAPNGAGREAKARKRA